MKKLILGVLLIFSFSYSDDNTKEMAEAIQKLYKTGMKIAYIMAKDYNTSPVSIYNAAKIAMEFKEKYGIEINLNVAECMANVYRSDFEEDFDKCDKVSMEVFFEYISKYSRNTQQDVNILYILIGDELLKILENKEINFGLFY